MCGPSGHASPTEHTSAVGSFIDIFLVLDLHHSLPRHVINYKKAGICGQTRCQCAVHCARCVWVMCVGPHVLPAGGHMSWVWPWVLAQDEKLLHDPYGVSLCSLCHKPLAYQNASIYAAIVKCHIKASSKWVAVSNRLVNLVAKGLFGSPVILRKDKLRSCLCSIGIALL